jgi:hypothetical protein
MFVEKWLHILAMGLVVVGAINWGLIGVFNVNLVAAVFGKGVVASIVYGLVGLAGLSIAFRRDTYLPFLGETVLPCAAIPERIPEHADAEVTVGDIQPGAKLLYWAAEPATERLSQIKPWQQAYLKFANAGVTTASSDGHATLRVRRPQSYTVPLKGVLQSHVHWRVCMDGGLLGPVQTTFLPL